MGLRRASVLLLLALGMGCSGISVIVDYDSAAPFPHLKSFRWAEEAAPTQTPADRRVQRAIDSRLRSTGFVLADTQPPDFLVAYLPVMAGYKKNELLLVIDICEPASRKVLWRTTARGVLNLSAAPEAQDERVQAIVSRALESFPPH